MESDQLLAGFAEIDFTPQPGLTLMGQMHERAAERVLACLEPLQLFAGTGHMEQMGWNRRAMFENDRSRMYGHAGMPGFVGMEGPRDPSLDVLFARDLQDKVRGVVVSFSTHPN